MFHSVPEIEVRALLRRVLVILVVASLTACGGPTGPASDVPDGSVTPLLERAERMRARGALDGAIETYREALDRTPWNDRIKSALAATLAERADEFRNEGRYADAVKDLEDARELKPEDAALSRNLAVVLAEQAARSQSGAEAERLRARAAALDPSVTSEGQVVDSALERKLELSFELVERDQLDAAASQLERLHDQYPADERVTRLWLQTLVRRGAQLSEQGNHGDAGNVLDRAVELHAAIPGCRSPEWQDCPGEDVRLAHQNRIVAYLNAFRPKEAADSLEDARQLGLVFPELATEIARQTEFE